jgi:hypothetical protein
MRQRIKILSLLGLLLAACSSGSRNASTTIQPTAPGEAQAPLPTGTVVPSATAKLSLPMSTPISVSDSMPGCTAKSLFPTPDPTTEALFPPVGEQDWVRGPDTASVTLIEYSDFQ